MIRVLHIVGGMNRCGLETFIMNVYRNIDRTKIQFDFIVHNQKQGDYDEEILNLGGIIYRITPKSTSLVKNYIQIRSIVQQNNYKIVHRHFSNSLFAVDLFAAKAGGAEKRIAHSHSNGGINKLLNAVFRPLLNYISTDRLACSEDAGKWLFDQADYIVINNAIDAERFSFNEKVRMEQRKKLDLENKFIIGHVGRFAQVKNHSFILHIFKELFDRVPSAHLLLVGDGELRASIKRQADELDLNEHVSFLGVREDIAELMQAMDVFVLPSRYEGLGIVAIEAQAAGLPCIVADTLPKEVFITDLIKGVSLEESGDKWTYEICKLLNLPCTRKNTFQQIKDSKYDIKLIVYDMESFYLLKK